MMLDRKRLGKQRIEAMSILRVLTTELYDIPEAHKRYGPWARHILVRMWRPYPLALVEYTLEMIDEWTKRGYKDTCKEKILEMVHGIHALEDTYGDLGDRFNSPRTPFWLGDERLHSSHRAALLYKAPHFYGRFGWAEAIPANVDYFWPSMTILKETKWKSLTTIYLPR